MQVVLFVIARAVQLLLGFVEIALLLRAILSWFIRNEENGLMLFLFAVTEPIILPFRVLFRRMNLPEDLPLDIPFSVTFLAVTLLNGFLPAVTL